VTCWTCHRGEEEPKGGRSRGDSGELSKLTADQLKQPAEKVFKDVRQLKGMDARNFAYIMGWFERSSGWMQALPRREGLRGGHGEEDARA